MSPYDELILEEGRLATGDIADWPSGLRLPLKSERRCCRHFAPFSLWWDRNTSEMETVAKLGACYEW